MHIIHTIITHTGYNLFLYNWQISDIQISRRVVDFARNLGFNITTCGQLARSFMANVSVVNFNYFFKIKSIFFVSIL